MGVFVPSDSFDLLSVSRTDYKVLKLSFFR